MKITNSSGCASREEREREERERERRERERGERGKEERKRERVGETGIEKVLR